METARELSRRRFSHGCSPYLCYFPELIPSGDGAASPPCRPGPP